MKGPKHFGRQTEVARRIDDMFGSKPRKPARGSADALDMDLGSLLAAFHAAGKEAPKLAVYPDQFARLQGAGLIRDGRYMGIPVVVVRRGTHLPVDNGGADNGTR